MRRLGGLFLVCCATGCAGAVISTAPSWRPIAWPTTAGADSPGGWWSLVTPDFVVTTNHDLATARRAAEHLWRERAAITAILGQTSLPPGKPITIFVLRDVEEFERLFGRKGLAITTERDNEVSVFISGSPDDWRASQVRTGAGTMSVGTHELVHALSRRLFMGEVRWLDEGLAEFIETYEWSYDWRQVTVGRPNGLVNLIDLQRHAVGVRDLAAWGGGSLSEADDLERTGALYAYAWGLVHYLVNREPETFARIVNLLGASSKKRDTLTEFFPGVEAQQLDDRVYHYLNRVEFPLQTLRVPQGRVTGTVVPLAAAEVAAAKATLAAAGSRFRGQGSQSKTRR